MLASDAVYAIKLRTSLPSSQDLFSDSDLMMFIDQELRSDIYPWITKQREEHFVSSKSISIVAGTANYRIPSRAFQNKLRDVQAIENGSARSMTRYWEEDRGKINTEGFFVVANQIEISPVPIANSTMKLVFHRKPSTLVELTSTAKIGSIDTLNSQVTVESLPSAILTDSLVDIVSQSSPYFAEDDITVISISGLTITLSSIPAGMQVGDYVCLQGETPFVQLPDELSDVLIQAVTVKVYESLGKFDAMKVAQEKLNMMKTNLGDSLQPRVEGEPKKIRLNSLARFSRW